MLHHFGKPQGLPQVFRKYPVCWTDTICRVCHLSRWILQVSLRPRHTTTIPVAKMVRWYRLFQDESEVMGSQAQIDGPWRVIIEECQSSFPRFLELPIKGGFSQVFQGPLLWFEETTVESRHSSRRSTEQDGRSCTSIVGREWLRRLQSGRVVIPYYPVIFLIILLVETDINYGGYTDIMFSNP